MTATKKRDSMIPLNPTTNQNWGVIDYGTTAFLWCPTARPLSFSTQSNRRNATEVYQKGLREQVQIDVGTGAQLRWRRIVFETKGFQDGDSTSILVQAVRRLVKPMDVSRLDDLAISLFEGAQDQDWTTFFTAKVDRNRVKLHSDRIRILRNGNDEAHSHSFRQYYPFEKKMIYNDDEAGDGKTGGVFASTGLKGMGDVFVVDFFQNIGGAVDDWSALWRSNATLYWHEK